MLRSRRRSRKRFCAAGTCRRSMRNWRRFGRKPAIFGKQDQRKYMHMELLEVSMEIPSYVTNTRLRTWVEEMVALCKPDQIYWCDGSQAEYDLLCEQMVESGTLIRLNPEKRPNSFLAR